MLGVCCDTAAWPASNISERGIRPLKTQQKISGQATTHSRLGIRGYTDTARKHGQDVLTVLRGVVAGNPWRAPVPAATAA